MTFSKGAQGKKKKQRKHTQPIKKGNLCALNNIISYDTNKSIIKKWVKIIKTRMTKAGIRYDGWKEFSF
jgi:hypothetical protein